MTRLKATGMTLDVMKRYRKFSKEGSSTVPQRVSILIAHKKKIKNEIDRLLETQRIIDYKIDHYGEVLLNPNIHDTACDPVE